MSEPLPERRIREGGLYRCCIETINTLQGDVRDEEGALIKCMHCGDRLRFRAGAWEWALTPVKESDERA